MKAKFIKTIVVTDPDDRGDVEVTLFKHENGGIFGVDSSYLIYLEGSEFEEDELITLPDVFNEGEKVVLDNDF